MHTLFFYSLVSTLFASNVHAVESRAELYNRGQFPSSSLERNLMSATGLAYRGDYQERTGVTNIYPLRSDVACRQAIAKANLTAKTVAYNIRCENCEFLDGGTEGYSTEVCNIDCDAVIGR
jgi:hypothetical protein